MGIIYSLTGYVSENLLENLSWAHALLFLGFPVIVFLGVLSLVPLLLVDFFLMLIRKWDTL